MTTIASVSTVSELFRPGRFGKTGATTSLKTHACSVPCARTTKFEGARQCVFRAVRPSFRARRGEPNLSGNQQSMSASCPKRLPLS